VTLNRPEAQAQVAAVFAGQGRGRCECSTTPAAEAEADRADPRLEAQAPQESHVAKCGGRGGKAKIIDQQGGTGNAKHNLPKPKANRIRVTYPPPPILNG